MHDYCFVFNGISRREDVIVSAGHFFSAAGLHGKGVFTTVRVRDGEPFLWEKHWKRLADTAAKLRVSLAGHSESFVLEAFRRLAKANELRNGRVRVTFLDTSAGPFWVQSGERSSRLLIHSSDVRPVADNFSLSCSPYLINSTSPLAGLKSCNYLDQVMAFGRAKNEGTEEAIRLNERGQVTSACMANVFWEKDGKLYTPSLSTGCLPGTTREFVLENAECEEVESGIEVLESADRIFLTSAGLGVTAVSEFNGGPLDTSAHPITRLVPS